MQPGSGHPYSEIVLTDEYCRSSLSIEIVPRNMYFMDVGNRRTGSSQVENPNLM